MPVKASAEKRELILKIYKYFGAESKRKAPFYAWNKVKEINIVYELFNLWKKTSIKQEYYLIYIFI
jgi:hypothetical protein